jgi:asparagine synthase (glutamine-hydrolysing)
MCGILAILSRERPVAPEWLRQGIARLRQRGPDGASHWIAPNGHVGLAQSRLSIIDLSKFTTPIANEDESIRVVVNGEFYDFEGIRADLQKRGHRFRTSCDSEIVLHLYEDFGEGCIEQLRGEFAFVLWDEKESALLAARDRFGVKPLFYAETEDALFIASEVNALFGAGVSAAWDRQSVFQNLFLCLNQDQTLFKGVRQVAPGHLLSETRGAVRVRSYWDLDYPKCRQGGLALTPQGVLEELRHRLRESVQIRIRSDVTVACYLSGGLDSSGVLGLATSLCPEPVPAFTVAFDHTEFDESNVARSTATTLKAPFVMVRVTEADIADYLVEAVSAGEMVHYNGHGVARYLLSRTVHEAGYKVVLAGEGADELFAGYDFARVALERSIRHPSLVATGIRYLKSLLGSRTSADRRIAATSQWLGRLCRTAGLAPSLLDSLAQMLSIVRSLLARDFASEFESLDPYGDFIRRLNPARTLRGREPVHQLLYVWMKSLFPNYVLGADRLDMAHAVEVRLPFLDHKLFEFARKIPPNLLLKDGRRKYVFREAIKSFVTERVYLGQKHPFFAPPSGLRRANRLHTFLQDSLRDSRFSAVPFFDPRAVADLLHTMEGMDSPGRATLDPLLFMLASMRILQSRYGL